MYSEVTMRDIERHSVKNEPPFDPLLPMSLDRS